MDELDRAVGSNPTSSAKALRQPLAKSDLGDTVWTQRDYDLHCRRWPSSNSFGYIGYQRRRDRLAAIRETFDDVIGILASNNEEQRLAGAILLSASLMNYQLGLSTLLPPRRRAPYAQEAVSVIAAVLRGLQSGNFQKLLADSLAYAPDLKRVDLQKTNLQNSYLLPRRKGVTLERVDFYRADLSGATLKGASAPYGIFYQSRLCHTVFSKTDLRGANFFQADLTGAQFDGAALKGASFKDARNVPQELLPFLDKNGTYISDQPGPKQVRISAGKPQIFQRFPCILKSSLTAHHRATGARCTLHQNA